MVINVIRIVNRILIFLKNNIQLFSLFFAYHSFETDIIKKPSDCQ